MKIYLLFSLTFLLSVLMLACSADDQQIIQGIPGNPGPSGAPGLQGPQGPSGKDAVSPQSTFMVNKLSAKINEPLVLFGSGFIPGEAVSFSLKLQNSDLIPVGTSQVRVLDSGAFVHNIQLISDDTLLMSTVNGMVSMIATGSLGTKASFPLQILNNTKSLFNSNLGASIFVESNIFESTIHVLGSGFKSKESVVLYVDNDDIDEIKLIEVIVNSSGLFEFQIDPKLSEGHYLIRAVGLEGTLATSSFLVEKSEQMDTPKGATIVATSVPPGEISDIYGSGFLIGEIVSVVILEAEDGADRIVAGNETNSSGAFLSSVKIDLKEGLYTIKAEGNLGSFATAPLLVASK